MDVCNPQLYFCIWLNRQPIHTYILQSTVMLNFCICWTGNQTDQKQHCANVYCKWQMNVIQINAPPISFAREREKKTTNSQVSFSVHNWVNKLSITSTLYFYFFKGGWGEGGGGGRETETWLKSHGAAYFTFQSRDCNPCTENYEEGLCTAYRSMSTYLNSSQKHLSLLFLVALLLHFVQLLQKLQLATHIWWNFVARVHFVNLHPVLGNDRQLADEVSQSILSSVGNDASNIRGNSIQPMLLGWKVKIHVWW